MNCKCDLKQRNGVDAFLICSYNHDVGLCVARFWMFHPSSIMLAYIRQVFFLIYGPMPMTVCIRIFEEDKKSSCTGGEGEKESLMGDFQA